MAAHGPVSKQRQGGGRRAGEQPFTLIVARGQDTGLEELKRHAQLELLLQVPPARHQQLDAPGPSLPGHHVQHGGLARSVRPLHGQHRPAARGQPVERGRHELEHRPALEERAIGGWCLVGPFGLGSRFQVTAQGCGSGHPPHAPQMGGDIPDLA